jgi:FkbM family methyltransferase
MKDILNRIFRKKLVLPESGFIEIKKSGFLWRVNLSSCVGRSVAEQGVWEPKTTTVIQSIVKPGMHVLDIGANFGYYSMIMAQIVGLEGKVWAFEPVKKFRDELYWHIEKNNFKEQVVVVPFGLSNELIQIPIFMDDSSATLYWTNPYQSPVSEMIQLKRLDDEVQDLKIKEIDFIKIDIDGNEPQFLRGARKSLLKHQPLIALEFAQHSLHVAKSDVREQARLLADLEYVICRESDLTPYKAEMDFLMDCGNFNRSGNVVAIPKKKLDDYQGIIKLHD